MIRGAGRIPAEAILALGWIVLAGAWIALRFSAGDLLDLQPDEMVVMAGAALVPPALLCLMAVLRRDMAALSETAGALAKHLESFVYPSDKAEERAQEAGLGLRRLAETLTTASTEAVAKLDEAAGRLGGTLETGAAALDSAIGRAAEVKSGLGDLAESVTAGTERLATLIAPIEAVATQVEEVTARGQDLFERETAALAAAAEAAETRIEGLIAAFAPQADQIAAFAADLARGVEAVQSAAGTAIQSLSVIRDGLTAEAERLAGTARQASARMEEVGESTRQQLGGMAAQAEAARERLAAAAGELAQRNEALTVSADTGAAAVQTALDRAREIAGTLEALDARALALGETMDRQSREFAEAATEALRRAEEQVAGFEGRLGEAAAGADGLAGRLEALGQTASRGERTSEALRQRVAELTEAADQAVKQVGELTGQASDLVASMASLGAGAGEAGAAFEGQAATLRQTTADLAGEVRKVRDASIAVQREGFLKSATFIIESMHSLAVDLTRILDREVPDAVWKRFHAGDRSVFTRHLLQLQARGAEAAIKRKFEEDGGFRDFVQRYLREFEGLLAQAKECDHQDVLGATFVTADVGKLYLLLANAVGRLKP